MTINSITANPIVLNKLKQAIGGGGTGGIQNVISLDTNINSNVVNDVAELSLNNNIEVDEIDIKQQILLNGLEGNNNDVLISQGAGQPNIWAPMPTIPDTLISNSLYVNDNIDTIKSKIDLSNQGDVIYISAGSYGEPQIQINAKYNMALSAPPIGTSTICEVLNGINITNTSELIRVSNLAIKGTVSTINPIGRCIFHNVVFVGVAGSPHNITIGAGTTKYLTFNQVEFDSNCVITIPPTFASVVYFINCNFSSASIVLNNALAQQVIFNNCSGFVSYPSNTKSVMIGLNVLSTGLSQVNTYDLKTTLINGSAYPPSGVSINPQYQDCITFCSNTNNQLTIDTQLQYNSGSKTLYLLDNNSQIQVSRVLMLKSFLLERGNVDTLTSVNEVLTTDGVAGFKLTPIGGENSNVNLYYAQGQQTPQSGASSLILLSTGQHYGKLYNYGIMWSGIFNFSITSNSCILTITLTDKGISSSYTQSLTSNGHHQINLNLFQNANMEYDIDATITFAVDNGTISVDANDYYSIQAYNIKNFATGIPV